MSSRQCIRCKKWKATRTITSKTQSWCYSLLNSEGISFNVGKNCDLCNKCWLNLCNQKKYGEIKIEKTNTNNVEDMDVDLDEDKDSLTIENIIFAGSGHKNCIICRSKVHAGSVVMPKAARLDLLVLKRMYAPHGVRICTDHLWNDRLLPDTKANMENRQIQITKLDPSSILQLFNAYYKKHLQQHD